MSDSLLSRPIVIEVNEDASFVYTADVVRQDGAPAVPANLDKLELTLYNDTDAKEIINSREDQDVLNTNDVVLDNSGNLAWNVQPEDNAIVNQNKRCEDHIAQFKMEWTQSGQTKRHYHFVILRVLNNSMIGS
jgi:hypothetical protein